MGIFGLIADATVIATAGGMTSEQGAALTTSLQTMGSTLLDNLVILVPALAGLAAIGFVIAIVRKKVKA